MTQHIESPFIGISRHRINSDGEGVTTLVAFHGCPLKCKYCLNPQSLRSSGVWKRLSPEQVFKEVSIDNLYFLATSGGITFGGGEPLLNPDFLLEFKRICNPEWNITVETSLNINPEVLVTLFPIIDKFIVDIKDLDPAIYKDYTGKDNSNVIKNLEYLLSQKAQDRVIVKTPFIKGFNTREHLADEKRALRDMGFENVVQFDYVVVNKK